METSEPELYNAISGVDQALWDIKGKVAGMPVYELFGGKSREAAAVYVIPRGQDREEHEDHTRELLEKGFHHIKFGWGGRMTEEEKEYYQRTVVSALAKDVEQYMVQLTSYPRPLA